MLILACAPLGNPGDATTRLREVITSAKFIAAEDSRKLTRLAHDLGIVYTGKVISYFEGNESERLEQLTEILESGEDLLVITDAGAPGVSDPGYRLIRAAIEKNIEVKVLPGPSAPVTALLLSGAPTDRFCFEGFTPRTSGTRKAWFEDLAEEERTIIFFEAPHRLKESLVDACAAFGAERMGAICREMTKTYEETIRGTLGELLAWSTDREILGEITIVLHGFDASTKSYSGDELVTLVLERESAGMSRKDAIGIVAKQLDLPKRQVFDALVAHKSADKI
jgi:16S rRNA (cytidine1402-2'-O)-methyltransferase